MNSLTPSPTLGPPVRLRTVLVLIAGLLLASACGSSASNDPQATSATSETSSSVTGSADDDDGASNEGSDADASTPTTDAGSNGDVAAESEPLQAESPSAATTPVSAELAHDCVSPGGTQTITITSEPQVAVGYQTVYSDGTRGSGEKTFSNPDGKEGYGGNNGGLTDASGRWTDTWTVSPEAPEGTVQVQAFATGYDTEMGADVVTFSVAKAIACA